MADKEQNAIVNTPATELSPAPKRNEGVAGYKDITQDLGDEYGTLHKPGLVIDKENGERSQDAIVNKPAQKIDNQLGVASARKIILPSKNDLVDGNGNPLISGGGSSGDSPRLIEIPYDFNEIPSETISQLRVGDVVKSKAVVIGTVTYKDETDVTIVSIDASCVTYYYYHRVEDGEWAYDDMASYDLSEMNGKADVSETPQIYYISDWSEDLSGDIKYGDVVVNRGDSMAGIVNYIEDGILWVTVPDYLRVIYEWNDTLENYGISETIALTPKLYQHSIKIISTSDQKEFVINLSSNSSAEVTNFSSLWTFLLNRIGSVDKYLYGAYSIDTSTGSMISDLVLHELSNVPTISFTGNNAGNFDYDPSSSLTITDSVLEVL